MRTFQALVLLIASNSFMTFAWYFHLKQHRWVLPVAIVLSWLVALPEYCLQVPANRLGHVAWGGQLTAPQLKVIQEAISLTVFAAFSFFVLEERLKATDVGAFALIFSGVALSMWGKGG